MSVNSKMTAIADAIRSKTGKTDSLTLDQMPGEIDGIQAGGGASGENVLDYAFALKQVFGANNLSIDEVVDLDVSFGNKVSGLSTDALSHVIYRNTKVRTLKISCGAPVSNVSMNCFAEINLIDTNLEKVDLTGAVGTIRPTNMTKSFYCRTALREILGELDVSQCTTFSNAFARCDSLETVQFKPGTINCSIGFPNSDNLTDVSIVSIIDGLADMSGGTAQTLTFHATVGAKLTDDQKATVSAKNWTLAY